MNRTTISDKYEYVNEDSVNEYLKCKICSNPFIDPVKTKCKPKEHAFCRHCIRDWLQRDLSCPTCRQNVKNQDLTPIAEGILLDVLNRLPVKCLLCKKTGIERVDFNEHMDKKCTKRKSKCSSADIECPWTGPYDELEKHLITCPYTALNDMLTQIITNNRQLTEQVNQQQIQIDTGKFSIPNNRPLSATKVSCDNCSDCWRGAVRGGYFRGQLGGGFKPGHTLTPCDCNCHK
ncbi:unnamed protein product [Rotaria sp. Silwood1]|nr:unnamed protein product [Rotaria sp. Silwood1]CAF1491176.1 unnamed protein product [Rotaria sp. Silwood1]CAF3642780.1 unnamed protein product [Rotaria sp. Silwood1]CAF3668460.1 unnamed protein product [Rotaria sp. Silwood1]CAF4683622.1 unnamed protein product [Rotaria sp. Silwood1]